MPPWGPTNLSRYTPNERTSMKRVITSGTVLIGLTCGLLGQGYFVLDNSALSDRVSVDRPGNPYSGVYGMEVWMANNSDAALSEGLDAIATTNGLAAYA